MGIEVIRYQSEDAIQSDKQDQSYKKIQSTTPTTKVFKKSKLRLQNAYATKEHSENDVEIHDNSEIGDDIDLEAVESVSDVIVKSNILKNTILDDINRRSDDLNIVPKTAKVDVEILSEDENVLK